MLLAQLCTYCHVDRISLPFVEVLDVLATFLPPSRQCGESSDHLVKDKESLECKLVTEASTG